MKQLYKPILLLISVLAIGEKSEARMSGEEKNALSFGSGSISFKETHSAAGNFLQQKIILQPVNKLSKAADEVAFYPNNLLSLRALLKSVSTVNNRSMISIAAANNKSILNNHALLNTDPLAANTSFKKTVALNEVEGDFVDVIKDGDASSLLVKSKSGTGGIYKLDLYDNQGNLLVSNQDVEIMAGSQQIIPVDLPFEEHGEYVAVLSNTSRKKKKTFKITHS